MSPTVDRRYRFDRASQWAAGARSGLALSGDRLVVPAVLSVERVPGTGSADAGALPSVDDLGRLSWLRLPAPDLAGPAPAGASGVLEFGRLDAPAGVRRLVTGSTLIWTITAGRLDRYSAATLERLSLRRPPEGARVSDGGGDGHDGLWVAETGSAGGWRVRHLDCWGRDCRSAVEVPGPEHGRLGLAVSESGLVVVLDPLAAAAAHVVDPGTGSGRDVALDVRAGYETWLAAGAGDRVHLLDVPGPAGPGTSPVLRLRTLNLVDGSLEDQQDLEVPARLGRPTEVAGGSGRIVLAGPGGLAEIGPSSRPGGERRSVFITPALTSTLGPRPSWNRVEIDAGLPEGTAIAVTWAATDDSDLVARAAEILAGPLTATAAERLDDLLPWQDADTARYPGTGDLPAGSTERLAARLDRVPETTLWIRVVASTPPGRRAPELAALTVRYPDASYLDDLPAVYRDDALAADQLRAILAPYQLLFDGLDDELAGLPGRIDPSTTGDDWTDYLLGWLGFPPLGDLPAPVRRVLLQRAPEVLERRGTRAGLTMLLDVVTAGRATVTDSAEAPVGWFLGPGDGPAAGGSPARLGRDTLVLAQRPAQARTGAMVLGRTPVGRGCPDPQLTLADRASVVRVRVGLDPGQQTSLRPVLDRLLPDFVPAHCRLVTEYATVHDEGRTRRLDLDFRLAPDHSDPGAAPPADALLPSGAHWQLGASTRLGEWPLPAGVSKPFVLGQDAALDRGRRLQ
jgi:phage tail-like protein